MPFIKLINNHVCELPKVRDDGSSIQNGDEWQCGTTLQNNPLIQCTRVWRYCGEVDGVFDHVRGD